MNVLVVVCHPRKNSLTYAVAERVKAELIKKEHHVEVADLYAENFDPRLMPVDEPDWEDADKEYSASVKNEVARIKRADALVMVFPVWWWNMPAMLKGWIDRVWGYGFAYGEGNTLPLKKIVALGVAANAEDDEDSKAFFDGFRKQMSEGIFNYCGVADGHVHFLCGSLNEEEHVEGLLVKAEQIISQF